MHVLLIGGTGYIGRRLVRLLLDRQHRITVLANEAWPETLAHVQMIVGDRSAPDTLETLAQLEVDAVVDLIAYRPEQTQEMVRAFSGRIRRYVQLSTIAVYAPPFAFPLRESGATLNNGSRSYSNLKADCERVLEIAHQTQGFPSVVLRSTPIMGPDDPVSRELYFLKRLLANQPLIHPWPGDSYVLTIFIDDLVEAVYLALTNPAAVGKSYHLSAADSPTVSNYIDAIARFAGIKSVQRIPVDPQKLIEFGFSLYAFPYAPGSPGRLDVSLAQRELGFAPTPFQEALDRTLHHVPTALAKTRTLAAWPGRTATQTRLCGTHELLHEEMERCFIQKTSPPPVLTVDELLSLAAGIAGFPTEQTLVHLSNGQLVGLIEPVLGHPDRYNCYRHQPLKNRVDYTHDNVPAQLYVASFGEVDKLPLTDKDRVWIRIDTQTAGDEFGQWLASGLADGVLTNVDLNRLSKYYVAAPTGLISPLSVKSSVALADWISIFGLARQLQSAGSSYAHHLRMGRANHCLFTSSDSIQETSAGRKFLDSVLKVIVDGQHYLYDSHQDRLCRVPKPFAILLDYFDPADITTNTLERVFDLDASKAARVYEVYRQEFDQHARLFYQEPTPTELLTD